MKMKEIFGIEVVVEKKRLALLHACLGGEVGICRITKLRDKVNRDMTMEKWNNGAHGGTV